MSCYFLFAECCTCYDNPPGQEKYVTALPFLCTASIALPGNGILTDARAINDRPYICFIEDCSIILTQICAKITMIQNYMI